MDWIIFVIVVSAVVGVVVLAISGALTWLIEKLGLAGNRDPLQSDTSHRVGIVKVAFVTEPGRDHATGTVEYCGELWTARCEANEASALQKGTNCRVIETEGLKLLVRKDNEHERSGR